MFDELKPKALRIAEALYRATDLFSDTEPLKWSLRSTALDILNVRVEDFLHLEALVKDISLKLDLASSGTFISKLNFEVIKRAYSELLGQAMSMKDGYKSLLDNIVSDKILLDGTVAKLQEKEEPSLVPNGQTPAPNGRTALLLSTLKQKNPMGVGDLTKVLGEFGINVSEKTVQREMSVLVAVGAVKQEGDKRWRRYFIG